MIRLSLNVLTGFLMFFLALSSCENFQNPTSVDTEYYINRKGDTMTKTIYLENGIYRTTNYSLINDEKRVSKISHHYKDVTPHGKSIFYHSNEKLKSIVEFRNGKIWDVQDYRDSSGNKLDYGRIKNGNGYLKKYYKDISVLEEEGRVIEGFKQDYWIQYCGDGKKVCDSILYEKGKSKIMKEIEKEGLPVFQTYK